MHGGGGARRVALALGLFWFGCGESEGSDAGGESGGEQSSGGASGASLGGMNGGTSAASSGAGGRVSGGIGGTATGGIAGTATGGVAGTATGGVAGMATGGDAGAGGAGANCGDGERVAPEGCDDGNSMTGDGCSPGCRRIIGLSVGCDGQHTVVILDDGSLRSWGNNWIGQLGLGDIAARGNLTAVATDSLRVDLGTGRRAQNVAAGRQHACAVLDDGTIKCWGGNGFGELGLGEKGARGDQPGEMGDALPAVDLGSGARALAVVAGAFHNCALLEGGRVKCWGYNNRGQLGLGDVEPRGDGPGEMGDALPALDFGAGRSARAIAAGFAGACALLDNGAVKCWGQNGSGGLGVGAADDRGDAPNEMGDALPAVDLGTGRTATAIAAGSAHSCALLDNAEVKCWGVNARGQLGLGDLENRGDQPNELGDRLPTLDFGAGRSVRGGLTIGVNYTCVILDNDQLKCWGGNLEGELGQGDLEQRGDQPGEMGDMLLAIDVGTDRHAVALTAGESYSCALLDDATLKCWGSADFGQLGLSGGTRGDQPGEMGDALPTLPLP